MDSDALTSDQTPQTESARSFGGMLAPLRYGIFRSMWLASFLSNMGVLFQGVAAAWAMTQLTKAPDLVALVTTAQTAPTMLLALAAGAITDMHDRRSVALTALTGSLICASTLAVLAWQGVITPGLLLLLCFLNGASMSLLWPAWQGVVNEQVPTEHLPAAIGLNSISFNTARSLGPALAGLVVATAGATAAFGMTALLYMPLLLVFYRWRRVQEPPRLPPEGLPRAMVSGVRYVMHSPVIRTVMARVLVFSFLISGLQALTPLVARDILKGGAQVYGLLLTAYGVGAIVCAFNVARIQHIKNREMVIRVGSVLHGVAAIGVALSPHLLLTALAMFIAGGAMMATLTTSNIAIQFAAPRWVTGRTLAMYQACMAAGGAGGAWCWGVVASHMGVDRSLLIGGTVLLVSPVLALWLRMPPKQGRTEDMLEGLDDPTVRLGLTPRSGPVIVEFEYRVSRENARAFYRIMQEVGLSRRRNGGYGWSLSRDVADPEIWIETYSCPTWLDYLHQRSRTSQAERELQRRARELQIDDRPLVIRRRLERPFGSVRWKEEVPDRIVEVPGAGAGPGV